MVPVIHFSYHFLVIFVIRKPRHAHADSSTESLLQRFAFNTVSQLLPLAECFLDVIEILL